MPKGNVIVVGGAGLIGAAAALHLAHLGYDVTICGRTPPESAELDRLPFLRGSYLNEEIGNRKLSEFDILVFAAGNDLRHVPGDGQGLPDLETQDQHFHAANTIGVPAFFARARKAGISKAIYVGSYYPQCVEAERVAASPYLRSRKAADEGIRALADADFLSCSLNAPFVLGKIAGVSALSIEVITRYLIEHGDHAWCIPGGANFISAHSFAQAVAGAIIHGEPGAAYLVGDENWTFARYFNLLLEGMGMPPIQDIRNEPHPALIDEGLYAGRGNTISFDPDPDLMTRLQYDRHNVADTVVEMAEYYREIVTR